jgi:hypothetical protein
MAKKIMALGFGDIISKSYKDRIEVSLANISRTANDKFRLLGMTYIPGTFKCELCGHEPCLKAFHVKNLTTDIIIKVGSECIHKFGFNSTIIDLALGLAKRVQSIVRKMRRNLKSSLDEKEYKAMSKEQKRMLITRLFMKHQAIEAIKGENPKKALLAKEDVLKVIQDNPWVEVDATEAEDRKAAKKEVKVTNKIAAKKASAKATPALADAAI